MITIYGAGEDITYEEVGAIELLKSHGVQARVLLPDRCGEVELHSARSVLSRFGVDAVIFDSGELKSSDLVVSFGRPGIFDQIKKSGERPKKLVYGLKRVSPALSEIKALSHGLIDEVFVASPRRAAQSVRELVKKAGRGIEFRQGYTPFCNPDSDFCKFYSEDLRDPSNFLILRDTEDSPEFAFPNYWAMAAAITAPLNKQKKIVCLGYGKNLLKTLGDPASNEAPWTQMGLEPELHPKRPHLENLSEFYRAANVLLHFFPADEVFSFPAAMAMLSGVVVVSAPLFAFSDLLQHGETGFIARSPDEAAYFASRVAWEPQLRIDIAAKAFNWFVTKGPGNADNCLLWWEPLVR